MSSSSWGIDGAGQVVSARSSDARSVGVLLAGHGSRDERGTEEFFQLGERLRQRLAPIPVAPCLLEFQRPTIAEAWQQLVEGGAHQIHVAPLLLFAAGHAKQDIPEILASCQANTPHVSFDQSGPISRHPAVIDLVTERLAMMVDACPAEPERTAVVMTGRGSFDPCAQADLRVLSEIIAARLPVAHLAAAFYAMAEPKLPQVLDQIAGSGRYRAVIVQPHLLFTGRLFQAICRQTDQAQRRHGAIDFRVSSYLGPGAPVVEAIADRIQRPGLIADRYRGPHRRRRGPRIE